MRLRWILAVVLCAVGQAWAAPAELLINGAGATFPYPIYNKWFAEYRKVHPNVKINYQSIGSGGGITQLQRKTVDFGASDAFMSADEISRNPSPVLHLPSVMGAVVITYNLKDLKEPLKLGQKVLLEIFEGKITKWNDPKILQTNPKAGLTDLPITLVTRSDGSGTTAIFTDYLAKLDGEFAKVIGKGKVAKWPGGVSGKGNEGVTGLIQQNPGTIGYVELVYAKENKLPMALLENHSGQFIEPSIATIGEAAASFKTIPEDFNLSLTNAPGKKAYPIAAFTYLLVYQNMEKVKGEEIVHFLNWAYGPGQKLAEGLYYAPLPGSVVKQALAKVKAITLN